MYKSKTNYWYWWRTLQIFMKYTCNTQIIDNKTQVSCWQLPTHIMCWFNQKIQYQYNNAYICYTFVTVTNRAHRSNGIVSSCGLQWKIVHINQFCEPCFAAGRLALRNKYNVILTKWFAYRWLLKAERRS